MTKKRPVISENSAFARVAAVGQADAGPQWGANERTANSGERLT